LDSLGDYNLDKACDDMGYESRQAGEVTTEMREAGAAVLGDPDLSYSHEEMAEAVYIAMETARLSPSVEGSILFHPFQISVRLKSD
jgi:hypothetical protein